MTGFDPGHALRTRGADASHDLTLAEGLIEPIRGIAEGDSSAKLMRPCKRGPHSPAAPQEEVEPAQLEVLTGAEVLPVDPGKWTTVW